MTESPFTNPFRYIPHPLVRKAAIEVIERLDRMTADGTLSAEVSKGFTDGKMLGVLVCRETLPDQTDITGSVRRRFLP